jgi:GntR family transcriptional regulator
MLDKNSPIPLYYQLAEHIRELIASGRLASGDQLAPERELAEQHAISRMTVRQALQQLIREEVLIARHGLGTFVAEAKLTYDPLHMLGFTDEMMRRGGNPSSRVIEQALVSAPEGVCARLALPDGARAVKITRLCLSGATPMLLETVHLPEARFGGLERADLSQRSLYQLMRDQYGVQPSGAQHTFTASPATEYETELFGVGLRAPMIVLQGVTFDQDNQPIEDFKAVYRGDRFAITLDSRAAGVPQSNAPQMSMVMR